ncbi:hypothetical protein FIBSPDRAFT_1049618 [Athelia psychrophila]|uniref:DNA replication checkpoint mediator MRC1 domain-containing protein n=1 Tax=Athelia psychrophila TaxID=1759441 RepID=A0A166BW99_9AGAM|nr:hypothetical protein FIBSPDRAFT_1049618 [Fibularhizoctonia sp. CBS 109695]
MTHGPITVLYLSPVNTYGRKRNIPDPDPDSSLAFGDTSLLSSTSSRVSGLIDEDEDVPPTSDAFDTSEPSSATRANDDAEPGFSFKSTNIATLRREDTRADVDTASSPARGEGAGETKHKWAWEAELAAIDADSDSDNEFAKPPASAINIGSKVLDRPEIKSLLLKTGPPSTQPAESGTEDLFDGSLPTLTDSSQPQAQSQSHASPPASPDMTLARKPKRCIAVVDSDDDMADSTLNSPGRRLHPINTPKSRSSPTPPTSDFGLSSSKSRGKGTSLPRSVSPILFSDDDTQPKDLTKRKGFKAARSNRQRIKAPTKKELKETHIDKHRIIADKNVQIKRTDAGSKFNLTNLFRNVQAKNAQTLPVPAKSPSSDPIQPFTSSPGGPGPAEVTEPVATFASFGAPSLLVPAQAQPMPIRHISASAVASTSTKELLLAATLDDDSDEDLPEISDIIAGDSQARRAKQLAEAKKRILAQRPAASSIMDDDEDDLQVEDNMLSVTAEETERRRVLRAHHVVPSEGRSRQLALGGVRARLSKDDSKSSPVKKGQHRDPFEQLKESALPAFRVDSRSGKGKAAHASMTPTELNLAMRKRAEADAVTANRLKEEEWVSRGGKLAEPAAGHIHGIAAVLEKGIEVAEQRMHGQDDREYEEGSDVSDGDFDPELRGSASPGLGEEDMEDADGDEAPEAALEAPHVDILTDQEDEETEDRDVARLRKTRRSVAHRAVVDSDEDEDQNEENTRPIRGQPSTGNVLVPDTSFMEEDPRTRQPSMVHRGSLSSFDSPTDDENDKENDNQLMFDKGEDKENTAVVRHAPFSTRAPPFHNSSLFGLEEGITRGLSMSPSRLSDDEPGFLRRKPLNALREVDDEDPFASPSLSFATKMQRASTAGTPLASPPPAFGGQSPLAFSQFLGDEEPSTKSQLQPGFSESSLAPALLPLHASGSGGFSQWSEDEHDSGLNKLRKPVEDIEELSLTLDVGFQPALIVDDNLRRQADAIFEKEQAYLVEAANRKPKKNEELYVNDHGFLTQTRPDVSTPEIYRMASPSRTQFPPLSFGESSFAQSAGRHPLRTISVDTIGGSPEASPLKRLRRRGASPVSRGILEFDRTSPSPSAPKHSQNAFQAMLKAQARHARVEKKKLEKSAFVAGEAEESDDDDQFGFGARIKKDDGEDEDGDDQDKVVEGLVDDADMDEDAINEQLVMEKAKEHQAADDAVIEKLHMDAIEGKLRKKKRGGLGIDDDSEDDDDDDDDKRRRRQMAKKRRIDGDNLEALSKDPATAPFHNAYRSAIEDDNAEFAYLQTGEDTPMVVEEGGDMDEGSEPPVTITAQELREQLRAAARQNPVDDEREELDPEDLSWMDPEEEKDDLGARVKAVSRTVRARQHIDRDIDMERPTVAHTDSEKTHAWARKESKNSRNAGTGRSAVGAAVTGHKSKAKAGGGSLRSVLPSASASTAAPARRPVRVSSTMLSVLADKSGRFE